MQPHSIVALGCPPLCRDLSANRLSGPLPTTWGDFEYLTYLNLTQNSLNGEPQGAQFAPAHRGPGSAWLFAHVPRDLE